jgi:hypothetical protein
LFVQDKVEKNTILIYHTAAFTSVQDWATSDASEWEHNGRRAYFHQLIAAAKHVFAQEKRWHLVDSQQMSAVFHKNEHLRDDHHPSVWFNMQVMDIYLSLLKQQKVQSGFRALNNSETDRLRAKHVT